jgi:thiamine-phosphate pyrophosphorylase
LYVIADADVCARAGWTVDDFAMACVDGGARVLQIRAKAMSARALLALTETIVRRTASAGASVIVNDRADLARLAGAAGVHVGQDDLSPHQVRSIVGDTAVVGLSTHTPEQVARALAEPVSYIAIGPVFDTATKATGYAPIGLERVREAARAAHGTGLPVVAIGGITLDTAAAVLEAGAAAVAVITDLLAAGHPEARTREYVARLALHAR